MHRRYEYDLAEVRSETRGALHQHRAGGRRAACHLRHVEHDAQLRFTRKALGEELERRTDQPLRHFRGAARRAHEAQHRAGRVGPVRGDQTRRIAHVRPHRETRMRGAVRGWTHQSWTMRVEGTNCDRVPRSQAQRDDPQVLHGIDQADALHCRFWSCVPDRWRGRYAQSSDRCKGLRNAFATIASSRVHVSARVIEDRTANGSKHQTEAQKIDGGQRALTEHPRCATHLRHHLRTSRGQHYGIR